MSKNGKIDYPDSNDDQEDIRWFENYYEKHSKTKHLERLKNEDILNYIKDVEQNCRLETSSGNEDYAGTKKFSNCGGRCSGTRFRPFKKIKSKRMSRKKKNKTLKRERKRFSGYATDACDYCCSARKSHFRGNSKFTVRENSRRDLDRSTKSIHQHPNLSRNFYKYRESSPTLYGWYSRKNYKTWPAVTEATNLEITEDWSQNRAIRDSRLNRSGIANGKSANVHTSKLLRRNKLGDSCYVNTCPSIALNEKGRNPYYYNHGEEIRMRKLNEESGVGDFENQQLVNKMYLNRNKMFSYQASLQNRGYKEHYSSGYHYPVRSFTQPTFWGFSSRANKLTTKRLPETNSLLRGRTSQWENEIGSPLKAYSFITGTSIDRSYQRETNRKNNTDQRRRRLNILGDRESLYYCRPGLLRESGKLCEVAPTHEDKQRLGCCCENIERDEMANCSRYRSKNNLIRSQRDASRPVNKQDNYTTATPPKTSSQSVQSRNNDEEESEIYLSMEEDSQNEDVAHDNAFDVSDDVKTNNYDDATNLKDSKPNVTFLEQVCRNSSKVAWDKKLRNDLKSNSGEAMKIQAALKKKINRYPADKDFSFAIRTPGKVVSRDSSGLRYAVESSCDCKEPFHDPPAVCLTGSCTCSGYDENARRNNDDSSRRISDTTYCDYCDYCSSSSHDEKDPVKKLESFCEKVKAVNQDIFHEPSKSTYRNTTSAQEYTHGDSDEHNQSEFNIRRTVRRARSIEKEWLTDPTRLRLEKPKRSHSGANLEQILIYPPREKDGPPLTLYKRSSNISCRVKGDADTGFRYSVTYVQKFVSPTWIPSLSTEVFSREANEKYDGSADYD